MAVQKQQQQVAAVTQTTHPGAAPRERAYTSQDARPKFGFPIMWPRSSCMQDGIEGKRKEGA